MKKAGRQVGMLSDYDQDIYLGLAESSKVDELKENSMIKKSLRRALGLPVKMNLETGEQVTVTICDMIVANTLKDAINKPSTSKLKDLAAVSGELRESMDLNLQTPQELFGDLVINKKNE